MSRAKLRLSARHSQALTHAKRPPRRSLSLERSRTHSKSLIQATKARARGYRSKRKTIAITYLIAGKLPTPSPFVTPHDLAKSRQMHVGGVILQENLLVVD